MTCFIARELRRQVPRACSRCNIRNLGILVFDTVYFHGSPTSSLPKKIRISPLLSRYLVVLSFHMCYSGMRNASLKDARAYNSRSDLAPVFLLCSFLHSELSILWQRSTMEYIITKPFTRSTNRRDSIRPLYTPVACFESRSSIAGKLHQCCSTKLCQICINMEVLT